MKFRQVFNALVALGFSNHEAFYLAFQYTK
jgi:hypothetical protein